MKLLTITALFLTLSSCGLQNQIDNLRRDHKKSELRDREQDRRLDALEADMATAREHLTLLNNTLSNEELESSGLQSLVTILQGQVNSALVQIAVLQGYNNIVEIKDPCGAQGAYNEVLLKLSNGKYLASFSENSQGKNTRFVVLTDGTFQTTDGSGCYFTISDGGTVISNEHN